MPIATIEIHDHDGDRPFAASDAPSSSEARLASETLDSGDTNAFSSLEAGAIACGRDLRPHEQGQIVASR
ncbi:hypothetical protein LB515_15555 [Mesorhizobium sp. CA15]|uniref:hypothetical protein n=1 Tax=unclassified Mesorhizobium TaxID=325217 RepID=UPI001CCA708D|nr:MULTISPECIES: hypothetical protein [unclassified Mesorhizobium]MBZ9735575.1 hypothetical protein [Mesorhizobium sp. CA9]MBZ9815826.1 hypothetical protein [Mesorhizobium sp. CA7]MBZ9826415.1 hypothetical protein [Mesorhizobium sp. CA18]MBZ9831538.1 hypothetical protein [Mesorhizobium sp. CA2]MBZ9837949.1 hypothetical protein [Mesorhizobium sp. CA3]